MGFELFQKKQQAYKELLAVADRVRAVAPSLSREEGDAFLAGVAAILAGTGGEVRRPPGVADVAPGERVGAVQAVRDALAAAPGGLTAVAVYEACAGKFGSASNRPNAVLYQALYTLKMKGEVVRDDDKVYRLVTPATPPDEGNAR